MLKRFKWALIISAALIAIVTYPNLVLLRDPPPTPAEQSRLNFVTITEVLGLLSFGVAFQIITEYYRLHTPHTVEEVYRIAHPEIPDKYFENIGGKGGTGGKGGEPSGTGGVGGSGGAGMGEYSHGGQGGKGGQGETEGDVGGTGGKGGKPGELGEQGEMGTGSGGRGGRGGVGGHG